MGIRQGRSRAFGGAASILLASASLALPSDARAASDFDVVGPVIDGGHVKLPTKGFAISFPDDWTVRAATPEGLEAYWGDVDVAEGQSIVLAAERSRQSGFCLVTIDDPSVRHEPVLMAWYADWAETGWAEDPRQDVFERVRVDLPSGPAWQFDYAADEWAGSVYVMRGSGGLYTLECWSYQPADGQRTHMTDDDWLRIAESLEFLPDASIGSARPSPVYRDGHIERPDEGFAVTFPNDWTVEEVTAQTHEIMFSRMEPAERDRQRTILVAGSSGGYCVVVDFRSLAEAVPTMTSISAATGWFLADLATDPEIIGPQSTVEDLPAGPAGHITATDADGWTRGIYHFSDGDAWFYLGCRAHVPPRDDWLSIAETFEFLPAEE